MAITKKHFQYNPATGKSEYTHTVVDYVGRVLEVFRRDYQVMSDIYTVATFARVAEPNGTIREVLVNLNFELDNTQGYAEVDATQDALDALARHTAAIEVARQRREEELRVFRAEEERNRPVKGKKMEVFKGRKVPVGTRGTVAFVRDGSVLLKDDAIWQDRSAPGVWVPVGNLRAV